MGNGEAFLRSAALAVAFVKGVERLGPVLGAKLARKVMHIGTGPVFLLAQSRAGFSSGARGALWSAAIPALFTLQFSAVGLGLVRDDELVASVTRTGDRRELLLGPVLYGAVHVAASLIGFRTAESVGALSLLCAGDGLADVVGRRLGKRRKLPWSRDKSWAGSAALVLGGWAASLALVLEFQRAGVLAGRDGCEPLTAGSAAGPLLLAAVGAGLVESLPLNDVDNLTVPVVGAALTHALLPR